MQIEITMRRVLGVVIVVVIFATAMFILDQRNQIDELKDQLDSMTKQEQGIHEDWIQSQQEIRQLEERCPQ